MDKKYHLCVVDDVEREDQGTSTSEANHHPFCLVDNRLVMFVVVVVEELIIKELMLQLIRSSPWEGT